MTQLTDIAKQLGSRGGKKSVEIRLGGKSKEEVSEMMKKVRKVSLTKPLKNDKK